MLLFSFFAVADQFTSNDQQQQYYKKLFITSEALSASDPGTVFGESIDLSSGAVMFRRKDASLPGNNSLPFAYPTYYDISMPDFAGWKEDIPRIEYGYIKGNGNHSTLADGWRSGKFCSQTQTSSNSASTILGRQHTGTTLVIPELGTKPLLKNTQKIGGNSIDEYPYVTNNLWRISCYISAETNKEGFRATSPEGVTYFFEHYVDNQKVHSYERNNVKGAGNIIFTMSGGSAYRKVAALYVKRIEDRFGNYITYKYHNDGGLSKMESNDGRVLEVKYLNNEKVLSLTDNTLSQKKEWHYFIRDNKYIITEPDNREWSYSLFINKYYTIPPNVNLHYNTNCIMASLNDVMTVTTPNGLIGIFRFSERIDYSSKYLSQPSREPIDCRRIINITEKKIAFSEQDDSNALIWLFEYSKNKGGYVIKGQKPPAEFLLEGDVPSNVDRFLSDFTLVKKPDGTSVKSYFDREVYSLSEGKVISKEYFNKNGEVIRTELFEYGAGSNFGELVNKFIFDGWRNVVQLKKIVKEKNSEYSTSYMKFNEFNTPTMLVEASDSHKKTLTSEYIWNSKYWILNLISKEFKGDENPSSIPLKEYVYDDRMLVRQQKLFGKLLLTNTYHPDGNLQQTTYADSTRYEKFEDYHRGKARKITFPCATTNGCNTANGSTSNTIIALLEVNSDGTTKSVTDFNGNKTSYTYNPIGWLTKIDYADPKWADKVISYAVVSSLGDGVGGSDVAVGSLRQTISQGNYEKRIYHDGLLRPILTQERDISNPSTTRYQSFTYDHDNRQTLASFPSTDASNRIGMETEYDALGRVITQIRTSDGSVSRREYLSGNKVAVTDGENNTTTTTYLAYGEPSFDKPTLIEAPDTDDVAIDYNVFGQVTSIRQGNVTETRIYDAYQQLCKQVRPETGISAFGYNGQRQQIWRAEGTNGSTTACDASAIPATHKVVLSYDNLGLLRTENFPDATPDKTYSYDGNGNLTSLLAGSVNWTYLYNSSNTIEKETLTLDGKNFVLDWEYNNLGALSSLIYPSGAIVDFAPNALGQATKAGSYASGVSYHPNGQIKQFTYGNGIVRNVALDTTGRIDALTDIKAGSVKNSLDPSYDYNDNLAHLIDWVDRNNDVDNLTYDGVDRLKSADGKWGTGRYNYDGLGNVLSRSLNNSTITYNYNSLNRLNNLTGAYAYGYQYDTRGNVTNNGRYSLAYNLGEQMTSAKGISYVYDGHNRRVKQTKADGSHYSVYSQAGQLLYREAANGTKSDNVFLWKQLIAEVDNAENHYIKFEITNPPEVCRQEPILGSKKTKTICTQDKKGFSWTTQNASSCTGEVQRLIGTNISGTTEISGTSGSLNLGRHFTLNVTMTCLTNSNQTITATYSL